MYVCMWSAKRPASRVDTRGHPYVGRKTEGPQFVCRCGLLFGRTSKNNGIIMNRIFDHSQNFATFYYRHTESNLREIATLIYPLFERINII